MFLRSALPLPPSTFFSFSGNVCLSRPLSGFSLRSSLQRKLILPPCQKGRKKERKKLIFRLASGDYCHECRERERAKEAAWPYRHFTGGHLPVVSLWTFCFFSSFPAPLPRFLRSLRQSEEVSSLGPVEGMKELWHAVSLVGISFSRWRVERTDIMKAE